MGLIATETGTIFDTKAITKRDLIRAQYHTWTEPRNGLVVSVSEDVIQVIYLPGIHSATCYFPIKAAEVAEGKWRIQWTTTTATVNSEEFSEKYKPAEEEDDGCNCEDETVSAEEVAAIFAGGSGEG